MFDILLCLRSKCSNFVKYAPKPSGIHVNLLWAILILTREGKGRRSGRRTRQLHEISSV